MTFLSHPHCCVCLLRQTGSGHVRDEELLQRPKRAAAHRALVPAVMPVVGQRARKKVTEHAPRVETDVAEEEMPAPSVRIALVAVVHPDHVQPERIEDLGWEHVKAPEAARLAVAQELVGVKRPVPVPVIDRSLR